MPGDKCVTGYGNSIPYEAAYFVPQFRPAPYPRPQAIKNTRPGWLAPARVCQAGTGVSPVIHLPGWGIFPPRRMNA
jgi:hypothetical protein